MLYMHLTAIFGILLFICCRMGFLSEAKKFSHFHPELLFGAALLFRLLLAGCFTGFGSDMACFAAWAERICQTGPRGFYSPEVFTDYPPGYMYVLYLIGFLRSLLRIPYLSPAHLILLKLPSILCDLGCGYLLYREAAGQAGENRFTPGQARFLCLAYLFNPVILLNSSVWGQVDSVFTLTVVLLCLSLVKGRLLPAYISFAVGVLIKPQALFFAPVLLTGFLDQVILKNFSFKKLCRNLLEGLSVLLGMVLFCLPFGLETVLAQYFSTIGSYPYAAVNACNLWGLFGLNWVSQDNTLLGIPYRFYGGAVIPAAVILVLYLSLRHRDDRKKYPLLGAVLVLTLFVFSVRMHERYLYPALALLLLAYIYRPTKHIYLCYGLFSLLHFYNTAYVLFFYDPANYDRRAPFILLVSAGMVLSALYLHSIALPACFSGKNPSSKWRPEVSEPSDRLKRTDWFCLLSVMLLYSCFALYDLGDTKAPETAYHMTYGQSIDLDFGDNVPASLSYYIAPWHDRRFTLETGELTLGNVFTWQQTELPENTGQLRLTLEDSQASLLEFVFLDSEDNILLPANAEDYAPLFDEQSLYPKRSSFRNSMYFDEIYHGRTAYEFLHGLTTYENTHPPLGKILISLGIACFGMNPFGWRIVGTLIGIAMVPFVYLFAKRMTHCTPASFLACVLFSFDFMHFTQTRIATIDVYITFFVILMYFFMFCYSRLSFYDTPLVRTFLPLGACGVSMGLGIACKWTGVYAGAGLAVIFFALLYRRYREYRFAMADPKGSSNGISHAHILSVFCPYTLRTILFCLIFFIVVPALIYLLSYLPFVDHGHSGLFARMFANQSSMFRYHSTLEATHPYSSAWYEWPILKRPVWYFSSVVTGSAGSGGLREGISAFGNPLVWWAGIPAALYMLLLWIRKKDRTAAFLTIGYLAQYLPWFFVTRITFIYHYFPSVVFVVLMIVYSFLQWKQYMSRRKLLTLMLLYGAATLLLFLLFYPVLSGQPVDAAFVDRWLRWFDSWVLTMR